MIIFLNLFYLIDLIPFLITEVFKLPLAQIYVWKGFSEENIKKVKKEKIEGFTSPCAL